MAKTRTLEHQIEALVPQLRPIENHILNTQDDYVKNLYLVLLVAIAREDNIVGDKEQLYLKALCQGIDGMDFDKILIQQDSIDDPKLVETLKALQRDQLAIWFLIDSIILCRIDAPLTEKEASLLGSIADVLKVSRETAESCVQFAITVLSHDRDLLINLLPQFQLALPLNDLHAAYVSSWMEEKLSFEQDILSGNELKGKYLINTPIVLSGEHNLQYVELVFTNQGYIRFSTKSKVNVSNIAIQNGHFVVDDHCEITFSKFSITGGKGIICNENSVIDMNNGLLLNTTLTCEKVKTITISEMTFKDIKGQRAIKLTNCKKVIVKSSRFESCGFDLNSPDKQDGGAIKASDTNVSFEKCSFDLCTASGDGGALSFWDSIYSISDSKFTNCKSAANGGALAIHGVKTADSELIKEGFLPNLTIGISGGTYPISKDSEFIYCSAGDSGGAFFDYRWDVRFGDCLFEKCSAKNTGGGGTYSGDWDNYISSLGYHGRGSYNKIYKCRFVECIAKEGNGLWQKLYYCIDNSHDSYSGESNDVYGSTFHKCTTNHVHEKNSVDKNRSCYIERQNKFTQ